MFHLLNNEIIEIIFKFCFNYDVFNLNCVNKNFYSIINSEYFLDFIKNRYHPLVFNFNDLYCNICNIQIYNLSNYSENFYIHCNHY